MELVVPLLLAHERAAQVDVVQMREAGMRGQRAQQVVELVDERGDELLIRREITMPLSPKSRLQPGPGEEPPSAKEAAPIGNRIVVSVRHDRQRTTQILRRDRGEPA